MANPLVEDDIISVHRARVEIAWQEVWRIVCDPRHMNGNSKEFLASWQMVRLRIDELFTAKCVIANAKGRSTGGA